MPEAKQPMMPRVDDLEPIYSFDLVPDMDESATEVALPALPAG